MSQDEAALECRILVIDDDESVHDALQEALDEFPVDSAYRGAEGTDLVARAAGEGRPYAVAFVAVRTPTSREGAETVGAIWEADPEVQIAVCPDGESADPLTVSGAFDNTGKLVILRKPYAGVDARQVASTLVDKWRRSHLMELEAKELRARTEEESGRAQQMETELKRLADELTRKRCELQEATGLLEQESARSRRATGELQQASHELRKKDAELQTVTDELHRHAQELKDARAEVQRMSAELQQKDADLGELCAEHERTVEALRESEDRHRTAEEKMRVHQDKLEHLASTLSQIEERERVRVECDPQDEAQESPSAEGAAPDAMAAAAASEPPASVDQVTQTVETSSPSAPPAAEQEGSPPA
jgi:hypothetical protein